MSEENMTDSTDSVKNMRDKIERQENGRFKPIINTPTKTTTLDSNQSVKHEGSYRRDRYNKL